MLRNGLGKVVGITLGAVNKLDDACFLGKFPLRPLSRDGRHDSTMRRGRIEPLGLDQPRLQKMPKEAVSEYQQSRRCEKLGATVIKAKQESVYVLEPEL